MPPAPAFILPSQRVEPYEDVEIWIQAAVTSVDNRQKEQINVAELARTYEVPVHRLRARLQGRQSRQERPGANRKLTEDQELAVCQYLDRLDTIDTSARIQMVSGCANAILQYSHLGDRPAPRVGDHWAPRFLDRHPEYFIRKQHTIDADRKNAHQPEGIRHWFEKYLQVCQQYNIQPGALYNFDETGFRIGIGRNQWIITRDPSRQAYLPTLTNRELVTVCEAISGDGAVLPPMIIVPGVIHQQSWYTATSIPGNYLIGTSETGYTNYSLTMDWLAHFERSSARRQVGTHRLLLLDGFGSHCTKQFIDYCDNHKIVVFCLPPHSSHLLQPLDVVVFQPYKHYHAEAVEAATRMGCGDFNKIEFLDKIDSIRQQTFKPSTIQSAFRATGLIPYDPSIVISKLREAAPPPPPRSVQPSGSGPSMPLTIATLKAQGEELLHDAKNMSPDFQNRLKLVLQGGLALAQSGALAMEHMENTQAAEKARSERRKAQNRRQIQNGGVLYADEARDIVKSTEAAAVEKGEQALRKAQNAKKRADTTAHKPFRDAIKAAYQARRKRLAAKKKKEAEEAREQAKEQAKEV